MKSTGKSFSNFTGTLKNRFEKGDTSYSVRGKRRFLAVVVIGAIAAAVIFIFSMCVGSTKVFSVGEMFSALFSAIGKGGANLTDDEIIIFSSRMPRTLAAIAVGVGLSIAGCMYQAVIRNPLCDPYIMGVSSGAGVAAIAVIAFNFTFFGLFPSNSVFVTAVAAMVGGVAAFFATMIIAEKAGGSSVSYVLGGVIVGLAFGAVQTLLMVLAGHKITSAMSWLFGSFANVSWTQVWMMIIPIAALSIVPFIWAKEFNLVLLGEDNALQLGLNVRKFNRVMLILASVLTSVCVAFVGIIGFVGLVVPHFCRMILGGDHRLVLPASVFVGSALMMLADFAARTLFMGLELPVGALTTIIGVPVFVYLLLKKGKMYDG